MLTYRPHTSAVSESGLEEDWLRAEKVRLAQKHEEMRVSTTMSQSDVRYTLVLREDFSV